MNKRGPKNKAVFFDRDGTLIVDKIYLNDPDAIEYLPGVFTALQMLRDAGYVFFVATNQSGVPRGKVTIPNLLEIHRRIRAAFSQHGVDILEFYYAPYLTEHDHIFRKPNPGMLLQGASEYNIDLGKSWMVGDKMVDVEAGHRAGVRSILVGNHEDPKKSMFRAPEGQFPKVLDAIPFMLKNNLLENKL
jgi:histidinol-phosphate phosphatase family protein